MKKIFVFALLHFIIFTSISGQNTLSLKEKYAKESIYLQTGFFSGMQYVKNGVSHHIGFFNSHLKDEMKISKDAFAEYKNFSKNKKTGIILGLTGSAMIIGGVLYTVYGIKNNKEKSSKIGSIILLTGYIPLLSSSYFFYQSNNNLHKAVWIRNRDLLEL